MKKILLWGAIIFAASLGGGMWIFTSLSPSPENTGTEEEGNSTEESSTETDQTNETSYKGPKIYVSFFSHNEDEFHPSYPNYIEDEETFWEHRNNAIAYAEMLTSHGATYNFQTDWNFLLAVQEYDQGDESTNGKNVIRYLHEDLGAEIDPHSHENGGYNFVDVAYLIEQTGVTPSGVVGGFIAGPTAEDSQLEYLWNLSRGEKYPSATWEPQILWGGGTGQHQNEDDYWISGAWRPQSAENFDQHDPQAPLPVVGNFVSSWEGLDYLLEKLHNNELDENGFYTVGIMLNQWDMSEEQRDAYEEKLITYLDEVEKGEIAFATITEIYEAWESTAQGEPTILHYDGGEIDSYSGSSENQGTETQIPQRPSGSCGDGTCSTFERQANMCPADCR